MHKFEIELNLEHIAQAKAQFNAASREIGLRIDKAMTRLIHEAAAQRMSVPQVAKLSGFSTAQIKARMKAMNLNPTTGKTLLSRQAADILANNATILGIEPNEIDLMSPLAYLPAGSLLKDRAQSQGVTDLDETPSSIHPWRLRLIEAYTAGYKDRRQERDHNPYPVADRIMSEADEDVSGNEERTADLDRIARLIPCEWCGVKRGPCSLNDRPSATHPSRMASAKMVAQAIEAGA